MSDNNILEIINNRREIINNMLEIIIIMIKIEKTVDSNMIRTTKIMMNKKIDSFITYLLIVKFYFAHDL